MTYCTLLIPSLPWPRPRRLGLAMSRKTVLYASKASSNCESTLASSRILTADRNQSKSPARRPLSGIPQHWRFLFDPDLRRQFACVVFVFEDLHQSTTRCILDEIAKKASGSKGKSRAGSSSSSASSRGHGAVPTDQYIFKHVFNTAEVNRVLSQPDLRYGLRMITA
ncbi:hypothetical protein AUP68_18100 [Ilyonectria robusta]